MKRYLIALSVVALCAASVYAADVDISKAKCPISGKDCVAASATDYAGGKIYFCCTNCPKGFAADPAKHATKANHQLVVTGQAKQVGCPISGKPVKAAQSLTIGDVEVGFCCPNCKKAASGLEGDEQLAKVFGDAAFKKAFKVGEDE